MPPAKRPRCLPKRKGRCPVVDSPSGVRVRLLQQYHVNGDGSLRIASHLVAIDGTVVLVYPTLILSPRSELSFGPLYLFLSPDGLNQMCFEISGCADKATVDAADVALSDHDEVDD